MFSLYKSNWGHEGIDEKYTYFLNYFQFCNTKSFISLNGFPQNHLSLLEKILFSLNNQGSLFGSSRKVVLQILNKSLFDTKNDFIARKGKNIMIIKKLRTQIQLKSSSGIDKIIDHLNELVKNLNGKDGLNDYQYFESLLNRQFHLLFCDCSFEIHKHEIQYITKCLVAEYYRRGFHKEDITGGNGVLKKILNFHMLKDDKKLKKSEFPLPLNIIEKKNSSDYNELIRNYLKSDKHNKLQLFGLLNYLNYVDTATFIFKIENVAIDLNQKIDLIFNDVNYFRIDTEVIKKYDLPSHWLDDYTNFFSNEECIFASTTITYKSLTNAKLLATNKIADSLNMVRYFINSKGGVISNNMLYVNGTLKSIHFERPNELELSESSMTDLKNYSVDLTKLKPEIASISDKMNLLYYLFIKGLSQSNDDEMISYFWIYFETAYSFLKGNKGNKIMQSVSKILLKEKFVEDKKELAFALHSLAMQNCESDIHGIPPSYYNCNREKSYYEESDEIVSDLKNIAINPFMKDLISEYDKEINSSLLKEYYSEILLQLYEQRNFIQHNGIWNRKSIEELKFYYQPIISGWQKQIYETANLKSSLTFKEIITYAEI